MKLLLDGGNSRIKWLWWDTQTWETPGILVHGGRTDPDLPDRLHAALEQRLPEAVWVVEVLGEDFRHTCHTLCQQRGWPAPRFLVPDPAPHGICSDYLEPARLGVDRYAAMVGARALGYDAAVIVDCGTAVTLDLLMPEGRHHGGLILPGLGLMRRSLGQAPGVAGAIGGRDDQVAALCTADAVASGTLQGLAAAITHLGQRLLAQATTSPVPPVKLLTGGDATCLYPLLDHHWVMEPHLVFRGLAHMADHH
ncbi:type III pantothenate kinase [Ectothiorhodospira magna]|uniref:Type III pantothenate kinase n=1 Tax=Ectothiorhodospira magna TaxID=867345 RepID=A0A1H9CHV9_9GAMM|nr:type III pantothenate kinase [Ectothiorhodospira magna]SEQ00795.1 type III pantothenate kinase [Ectothiorhodospira magna]